jgi:hypothetical protein
MMTLRRHPLRSLLSLALLTTAVAATLLPITG